MKPAKCTSCGANIEVDETKDAGICSFCNTAFVTEKAIKEATNITNNHATTIINNYYNVPVSEPKIEKQKNFKPSKNEPRPEVNTLLAVFLFILYIFPGFIYLSYIKNKQYKWDYYHKFPDKKEAWLNATDYDTKLKYSPRPVMNVPLCVLLFIFGIYLGLVYLISIKSLQSKWDKLNSQSY